MDKQKTEMLPHKIDMYIELYNLEVIAIDD